MFPRSGGWRIRTFPRRWMIDPDRSVCEAKYVGGKRSVVSCRLSSTVQTTTSGVFYCCEPRVNWYQLAGPHCTIDCTELEMIKQAELQ